MFNKTIRYFESNFLRFAFNRLDLWDRVIGSLITNFAAVSGYNFSKFLFLQLGDHSSFLGMYITVIYDGMQADNCVPSALPILRMWHILLCLPFVPLYYTISNWILADSFVSINQTPTYSTGLLVLLSFGDSKRTLWQECTQPKNYVNIIERFTVFMNNSLIFTHK